MKIGILQCDHVADDLVDTHGDYNDMFTRLVHAQDSDVVISVFDLTAEKFPEDINASDGYIVTGSQFSAYDDIPWIHKAKTLVADIYQAKIPTIGICFGHQLIAESLGGRVEKAVDKGWGVGVQQWQIKNKQAWMGATSPDNFTLRASHQDQVVKMPADSKLIAGSEFCPIAGFQCGEHFLTMQGHPEFSRGYSQALLEKRVDRIGKDTVDAALGSLTKDVDADIVGAWMIEFLKQTNSN